MSYLAPPRGPVGLILPDAHFPYQHVPSMRCVLKAAEMLKPAWVVVLGDWLNCEVFTAHPPGSLEDVRAHSWWADEVDPCIYYLEELRRHTKRIVYLEGNHENWVGRWLASKAGRLALTLEDVIHPAKALGDVVDTWVPYVKNGLSYHAITPNLWAIHGWSHSKHAARAHLDKGRGQLSIVHGHTHRVQSVSDRLPVTDQRIVAWSPGCLCTFSPRYMHSGPDGWLRAFSVVYMSSKDADDFQEYTCPIDNNGRAILPDGRAACG